MPRGSRRTFRMCPARSVRMHGQLNSGCLRRNMQNTCTCCSGARDRGAFKLEPRSVLRVLQEKQCAMRGSQGGRALKYTAILKRCGQAPVAPVVRALWPLTPSRNLWTSSSAQISQVSRAASLVSSKRWWPGAFRHQGAEFK